jgi:hypothetical protein
MSNTRLVLIVLILAAVALLQPTSLDARSNRVRIDSHWRDRDVVVDGSDAEWPGPLVQIDDKQPLSVAAVNDAESLYLVFTVSDQATRMQILRQGLIVWFDPGGGDKKQFGIKFPVGMEGGGMGGRFGGGGRGRRAGSSGDRTPSEGDDPGNADRFEPPNRLELLGPKKDDARSFSADRVPGLEVRIGQAQGSLVYELKIPIAKTTEHEYAIGTKPGALIGLGLETPKPESSREGSGGMGGGGGGGMGRPGGGMGGRGGGGMGGRRGGGGGGGGGEVRPKPIKAWALLQLAAGRLP